MRLSLMFVVCLIVCKCAVKDAIAECHLGGSVAFDLSLATEHDHPEMGFELLGVGSCQSPWNKETELYLELGFGGTTDRYWAVPVGTGFLYRFNDFFALGVSGTVHMSLSDLYPSKFLLGPTLQFTLAHHAGKFGDLNLVFVPGIVGRFLPQGMGNFGGGAAFAFEFTPG